MIINKYDEHLHLNNMKEIDKIYLKNILLNKRPGWIDYSMMIARVVSSRSQDPRVKVGAVALRGDNTICGVGYNGAPPGIDIDWENKSEKLKRVIHAEVNALVYVKPSEAEKLIITKSPCLSCLQLIARHKIKYVVYCEKHKSTIKDAEKISKELGIELFQYE